MDWQVTAPAETTIGTKYKRAPRIYRVQVRQFGAQWRIKSYPNSSITVDTFVPTSEYHSNFPPPLSILTKSVADEYMALKLYINGDVGLVHTPILESEMELVRASAAVVDALSVLRMAFTEAIILDGMSQRVAMGLSAIGTVKAERYLREVVPPNTTGTTHWGESGTPPVQDSPATILRKLRGIH